MRVDHRFEFEVHGRNGGEITERARQGALDYARGSDVPGMAVRWTVDARPKVVGMSGTVEVWEATVVGEIEYDDRPYRLAGEPGSSREEVRRAVEASVFAACEAVPAALPHAPVIAADLLHRLLPAEPGIDSWRD